MMLIGERSPCPYLNLQAIFSSHFPPEEGKWEYIGSAELSTSIKQP